jgi:signal transduction histidine kinase
MSLADRQRFVGIIVTESERLSRLVNQVLDLAKIESGNAEWNDSAVDLRALLEQAAATMGEMLRERGATLVLSLPDTPLPPLRADADRLIQVLLNLLGNAAKFVPSPGGRVELQLTRDAHGATVSVADNGPGVPAEQRALIFEKFRQGGDLRQRPAGTGLGLHISRQIVEHHGGHMTLTTDTGPGAKFSFTLPWRRMPQGESR